VRLLVIADARIPVPPDGYGGTERIVALLCAGLAACGHQVTLLWQTQASRPRSGCALWTQNL